MLDMMAHAPRLSAFLAWVVTLIFVGGVGAHVIVPPIIELHKLVLDHRETSGVIVDAYPKIHMTCQYSYKVNGQSYQVMGRDCGDATSGDAVTVYYAPGDPSRSINIEPSSLYANDFWSFVTALIIMPLFAGVATFIRVKVRARQQRANSTTVGA